MARRGRTKGICMYVPYLQNNLRVYLRSNHGTRLIFINCSKARIASAPQYVRTAVVFRNFHNII